MSTTPNRCRPVTPSPRLTAWCCCRISATSPRPRCATCTSRSSRTSPAGATARRSAPCPPRRDRTPVDRMSAQDATFLHIESDRSPMHVGGVSIFEGPAPQQGRFADHVAAKLDQVPRYRQVVGTVALGLGSPVWVDDPHFNLGYHLRRTALPAPGSDAQLQALVGRVMSQNLDRDKPLWEMWVVEGVDSGRWALLSKVHHSMVDGVAATDLMAVLLDVERDPGEPDAPTEWAPGPYPSEAQLLVEALGGGTRVPIELARGLLGAVRDPRTIAADVEVTIRGLI